MKNVFDYASSFKAATQICTQKDFERVIGSPKVKNIMEKISLLSPPTPEGGETAYRTWKEQVNALKKELPVLMPHAHFTDGKRHGQSAERSPWVSQDYDGIEDPQGFWDYIVAKHAEELHIVLAFISPSGKGVKIIFQAPSSPLPQRGEPRKARKAEERGEPSQGDELMTIKEAQKWFAEQIGEMDYDAQTFDLARCVYLVPKKNFLYYRPSLLFTPILEPLRLPPSFSTGYESVASRPIIPVMGKEAEMSSEQEGTQPEDNSTPLPITGEGKSPEGSGEGVIPYSSIIPEFFRLECSTFPSVPVGMRNSTIFNVVAKYLRYCTDHRFENIKALIYPDYAFGLDEAEIDSIIKSALSRERSLTPRKVKDILAKFAESGTSVIEDEAESAEAEGMPQLPEKLPEFIRLIVSKTPDCMKPAVATQVFPALAAHLHGVRFRYIDNREQEPGLLGVCIGKQSIGKGCVNDPIDFINADLKEVSDRNKALARQWRKESAESENDDTGLLPEDIYFPLPLPNMTDAAFTDRLRRAEHNGDRSIFTRMDEIELLYQVNVGGSLKPDRLICLAYDHAEYGQERVSNTAISDSAKMRWSWVASTTPLNGRVFFSKNNGLLNGALTRVNVCTVFQPNERGYMPVYGIYEDNFKDKVQEFVNRLNLASGLIYCPKINKFIEKLRWWCVDKEDEYEGVEHDIFVDLYKRSLAIAFRKSMILYILSGQKWTKTMEEFIEWSVKYDLWCKLYYFSDMMIEAYQGQKSHVPVMTQGKRVSKMDELYAQLPTEFTTKDVDNMKEKLMLFSAGKSIIYSLKKNGLIEKSGSKLFKKVKKSKSQM